MSKEPTTNHNENIVAKNGGWENRRLPSRSTAEQK